MANILSIRLRELLLFSAEMAEIRHEITKFGTLRFKGFDQDVTTAAPVSPAMNDHD